MPSTSASAADIAALFPHKQDVMPRISTATLKPNYVSILQLQDKPRISTVTSKPNYVSILEFQDKLVKNATAILFNRNIYGHLALVVDVWVNPVDPGLNPIIPNQATAAKS